ncbi:MAG: hypothetical protein HY908_24955, partial [Myxococcales bacterium]|nr:hypothetical protein [Myxococcales bacterium]
AVQQHSSYFASPYAYACTSIERDRFDMRARRSYSNTAANLSVPVWGVRTAGMYCQPNSNTPTNCKELADIDDQVLDEAQCANVPGAPPPPSCGIVESASTRFHRLSLYYSSTNSPAETGGDPNAIPKALDYGYSAASSAPGPVWRWDYRADVKRWVATGIYPELETSENAVLLGNDAIGTDLDGTLWFHADTPIGDTVNACGPSGCTGFHGEQLANHHKLGGGRGYHVHTKICTPLLAPVWEPYPYIFLDQGDPPDWTRWDAAAGESSVLVRAGSDWGAIGEGGRVGLATSALGPALRARLAEPGLRWANAVEPSADMGRGRAFPLAVALSPNGHDIVDSVRVGQGSILADADRGVAPDPRDGSPDAYGYAPVLSRYRGGVFVVGGERAGTGEPAGETWFTPLDSSTWSEVPTEIRPEHVLAATYSFASDALYVLDETGPEQQRERRLWTHDLRSNASRLLGAFPRHETWDRHAFAIDKDGGVLLASSSTSLDAHAVARIDAAAGDALSGIWRGTRPLLLPPLVDLEGYSFVLPAREGWPSETVVGVRSLWLEDHARIVGDVAVAEAATGKCLVDKIEAVLGAHAVIEGSLRADDVRLRHDSVVTGAVTYNGLTNHGTIGLEAVTPLALPLGLTPAVPAFAPGAAAVVVPHGTLRELGPGAYGHVRVKGGDEDEPTVLRLTGGSYDFADLELGAHALLVCQARCEIRVAGRLKTESHVYVGPAFGTDLGAADVVIVVRGKNGDHGHVDATPKAARIGAHAVVVARIYATTGTLSLGEHAVAKGTFVGREVRVGEHARLEKDEGPALRLRLSELPLAPATFEELGAQL